MGGAPSVRTQLLVLELGIALPLLGLIALLLFEYQADEERQTRAAIAHSIQRAAAEIETHLRDLDAGMSAVAAASSPRATGDGRCSPAFDDFLAQHPGATDLRLVGPGHRTWCAAHSGRQDGAAMEAVAASVDEAWRTGRVSGGRVFVDSRLERWSLVRSRPIERSGRVEAVLVAIVDLERLRAAIRGAWLPAAAAIQVLDSRGAPILDLNGGAGPHHATRARAPSRLAGRAGIPALGWTIQASLPVALGAPGRNARVVELGTLCVILLTLATGLALYVSGEIVRPIQALSAAAGRAASGQLDVRAPVEGSAETVDVARSFNAMLASRAEAEEALRQVAMRLRLAIQVTDVGLWELDLRTGKAFYSSEWQAQLGYSGREVGDRPARWREWLHPRDRRRVIAREDGFMSDPRGTLLNEFRVRHKDGRYRWILARVDVLRDAEGRPLRFVGCHVDVTALRGHHETQRLLKDRLRRAEQMSAMGSLVAGVAHEVRNPLFGITATVDALEARAGLDGPYAPYLQVLREQAGRLTRLMNDLLEYGRPHELRAEPIAPGQPIDDARHQCARLALERDVSIHSRVLTAQPIALDADRVSRALRNLVENAIQFSPPGATVEVEGRADQDEQGSWLTYEIADSGAGFREEDLAHVLEPFFSRRRGGTGLGLSIARRVAEEHGGRLRVTNRPQGGGRVCLDLPMGVIAPAAMAAGLGVDSLPRLGGAA